MGKWQADGRARVCIGVSEVIELVDCRWVLSTMYVFLE